MHRLRRAARGGGGGGSGERSRGAAHDGLQGTALMRGFVDRRVLVAAGLLGWACAKANDSPLAGGAYDPKGKAGSSGGFGKAGTGATTGAAGGSGGKGGSGAGGGAGA